MTSVREFYDLPRLLWVDLCKCWWREFYEWSRLLWTDLWTWWWRRYGSLMNVIASSEPTCKHDDDFNMWALLMTSPHLNQPVNMMMTSVRESYEWHCLLSTYLWTWWWHQYGSFINDLASSELTCEHDDDVNTVVLWMTSPPLNRPVNMMMMSVRTFSEWPRLLWMRPVYMKMMSGRNF